jgi:hypothetical protein|tara:strand:- start:17 stop:868 length:852 start_codon:yes stop_codon:yes gene_type:complete
MAIPLIARGAAALAKKGLKKLGKRRANLTKKEKAEGPLADTKPKRKTKVSKKKQAERRAANEAAAVKRGAKRFGAGAAGTAAAGAAGVAATRGGNKESEDKKPVAKKTENTRKPTAPPPKPKVKKKTVEERRQDADRSGPVGRTRITDDKGTKRFLKRDKLRKTAREATKVEKPPTVESAADSLRKGTARSVAEAKRKGLDTFTNVRGDEKAAVTKEELEASGMSLRDYLNKQKGKTRRGMMKGGAVKKPFKTGDLVKAKPKAKKKVRGAGIAQRGVRPCKMR